jgi:hypothetical protein
LLAKPSPASGSAGGEDKNGAAIFLKIIKVWSASADSEPLAWVFWGNDYEYKAIVWIVGGDE